MPAPTWTNQEKLSTQPSTTYNDSTKTYNQADLQYNGKTRATWTNQTEN